MTKNCCLSHWINEKTPSYGNKADLLEKVYPQLKVGVQ